jgi:hypothetical protein
MAIFDLRRGLVLSMLLLAGAVCAFSRLPSATLRGLGSDHYSHYGSAILFSYRGWDIYQRPVREICAPPTPADLAFARDNDISPEDLCELPERAGKRPLVINWQAFPRPYPPGFLLYFAPEALLYEHTSISFHALNQLCIVQFLLAAHAALALLARAVLGPRHVGPEAHTAAGWACFAASYLVLVRFSMMGFYDALPIALLFAATASAARERPGRALLWFGVACAVHFRAAWFLPFAAYGAHALWLRRREVSTRERVEGAVGLALCALVAALMLEMSGALRAFPRTNPFYFAAATSWLKRAGLIGAVLALLTAAAGPRRPLLPACGAWHLVMLAATPQMMPWHTQFLFGWLGVLRVGRPEVRARDLLLVLAAIVLESYFVYRVLPLPKLLLGPLLRRQF